MGIARGDDLRRRAGAAARVPGRVRKNRDAAGCALCFSSRARRHCRRVASVAHRPDSHRGARAVFRARPDFPPRRRARRDARLGGCAGGKIASGAVRRDFSGERVRGLRVAAFHPLDSRRGPSRDAAKIRHARPVAAHRRASAPRAARDFQPPVRLRHEHGECFHRAVFENENRLRREPDPLSLDALFSRRDAEPAAGRARARPRGQQGCFELRARAVGGDSRGLGGGRGRPARAVGRLHRAAAIRRRRRREQPRPRKHPPHAAHHAAHRTPSFHRVFFGHHEPRSRPRAGRVGSRARRDEPA